VLRAVHARACSLGKVGSECCRPPAAPDLQEQVGVLDGALRQPLSVVDERAPRCLHGGVELLGPFAKHEPPHRAGAGVTGDAEARARAEEGVRRVRPRVSAESGQRLELRGACW